MTRERMIYIQWIALRLMQGGTVLSVVLLLGAYLS